MICVCHRCGRDISSTLCRECGGECKDFSCSRCKGHYCHACLAVHVRENWCGVKGQTSLRQPAA
jgi:hypothetical protein